MEPKILNNNILISSTTYFENTARAVPPSTSSPNGKIVVVVGQPRDKVKIFHRSIYNSSGNIDTNIQTGEQPFPLGSSTRAFGTDNQIVRLKDGSLLAHKDSYVWDDIPSNPPAWFSEIVDGGGGMQKGQRGCLLFARSTDGGNSWKFHSVIDFATFLGGKYGYPQKHNDPNDPTKKWWIGGPDRTELYACPFTGCIYLTTVVGSGPYEKDNTPYRRTMLLLYSKDSGKTWETIREDLSTWAPMVMTSTPNGRLFLFQQIGNQPTVYFSKAPVTNVGKPEISSGFSINYIENDVKIPCDDASSVDLFYQAYHPTISRLSTDEASSKIRVAYQAQNSSGMQEVRVINVDVQNPSQAPVVTPVTTIRAEDPKNYSVMYATFIDPDYVDMPPGTQSNASILYWIEAPRVFFVSSKKYMTRYVVFEGDNNVSSPGYLSVKDGLPRTWLSRQDIGDYLTGGFFWHNNKLNYVAQWVEPDGIKANIVTLPYPFFLSEAWKLNANGFEVYLTIDAIDANNGIRGRVVEGGRTDLVSGFWDEAAHKLTFTREISSDNPATVQIYTGYLMSGKPTLSGTFEAFQGTGATAQRSVFGWIAQPL